MLKNPPEVSPVTALQVAVYLEALAELDRAHWRLVESLFEAEALDRYYRAELLFTLGRDSEALGWYRTIAPSLACGGAPTRSSRPSWPTRSGACGA